MKVGMRKPSLKKSFSARTTGRIKREIKKSINPLYNKKGIGLANDPQRAAYNKIYNKTTTSTRKILENSSSDKDISFLEVMNYILNFIGSLIIFLFSLLKVLFCGAVMFAIFYVIFKIINL